MHKDESCVLHLSPTKTLTVVLVASTEMRREGSPGGLSDTDPAFTNFISNLHTGLGKWGRSR